MKILNSNDSTQAQNEIDSRLVLPPAPVQQTPPQTPPPASTNANIAQPPVVAQKDEKLFEQVPINAPESKPKDEFEDMVKKLKEKENAKVAPAPTEPKEQPKVAEPKQPAQPKEEAKPEPKEQPKPATTAQEEPKKVANLEDRLGKAEAKFQDKSARQAKAPAKPAQQQTKGSVSGAYVQVSAVSNFNPNHELIKKLKASGYDYQTANVGGMTKVLVGPYEGAQLQKALADIRKNVNKNAFIYRAK